MADGLGDWYKQLVSLSSGFVGVTVVFRVAGDRQAGGVRPLSADCRLAELLGGGDPRPVRIARCLAIRSPSETDDSRRQLAGNLGVNTGLTAVFVLGIWLTVAAGHHHPAEPR